MVLARWCSRDQAGSMEMAHEGCLRWHAMNRAESRVAVLSATYRTAEEQIRRALQLLEYRPQRDKILLKPNLVTIPRWLPLGGIPRSAITDIRFIEALLRIFDGYEITIADGALATTDTDEVLEKSGVAALAREYGAQVVNLDRVERFQVPWAYGKLRLPALLQTHEYINVPKLKTHVQTGVTLGCKNQKGLLTSADKIRFHREFGLHDGIRALADVIQPALTIVDGVIGLDGPGPTLGRSRRSHLVVAGRDMRAVDVACCDLISLPLERVCHLDRVPYRAIGGTVEEMRLRFNAPSEMTIANVHVHVVSDTCSRCLQSMHDGLAAFWLSPYHILRGTWSCILNRTDMITGQEKQVPHAARGRLICYGDCASRLAEKHDLQWIPGCPPSVSEFLEIF
jgi:uncharacterized protein (DUF362 family)